MAASFSKPLTFSMGDSVEGKVAAITDGELVIDLNAKTEGVISKKEIPAEQLSSLMVGDNFRAFVLTPENESGQTVLSLSRQSTLPQRAGRRGQPDWEKFIQAKSRQTAFTATAIEVNKGGLLVEVERVRGFVPGSQLSLSSVAGVSQAADLAGRSFPVTVLEVDTKNNRLIFTGRPAVDDALMQRLAKFKSGEKVAGKVAAVTPFSLLVDVDGVEGVVFAGEISWEEKEDPTKDFSVGQQVEAVVSGADEQLGRLNLSIRQMEKDPFETLAENFQPDDVAIGTITAVDQNGVAVALENDVEGFLPAEKIEAAADYAVGQKTNFLVDSVDLKRRRVNLAPFITSTKGLIYR